MGFACQMTILCHMVIPSLLPWFKCSHSTLPVLNFRGYLRCSYSKLSSEFIYDNVTKYSQHLHYIILYIGAKWCEFPIFSSDHGVR